VLIDPLHTPRFRGRFDWHWKYPEEDIVLYGPHEQCVVDIEWVDFPVYDRDELELSLSVEFNRWDRIDDP
jgi:hypothetical protein